jgi:hypothetical protein
MAAGSRLETIEESKNEMSTYHDIEGKVEDAIAAFFASHSAEIPGLTVVKGFQMAALGNPPSRALEIYCGAARRTDSNNNWLATVLIAVTCEIDSVAPAYLPTLMTEHRASVSAVRDLILADSFISEMNAAKSGFGINAILPDGIEAKQYPRDRHWISSLGLTMNCCGVNLV